jgi:RNA polymerase sigma-70 factor (ECF subfamily)
MEARKIAELSESRRYFTGHINSGLTEDHEFTRLLQSAIDLLPPQQKKTYLLIHEELLSYQEVAARLRLSKLTVKRHLELARRSVRTFLTPYLDA